MNLKPLALAAALCVSSAASFAGTATFAGDSASFSNDPFALGAFTQTITFDGLSAGVYDIVGTLSAQNITWTSINLDGHVWDLLGTTKQSFAGVEYTGTTPLTLTLSGLTSGSLASKVKYSGELTVSAVPEPESYAMLLAGLGVMGAIARRRSSKQA